MGRQQTDTSWYTLCEGWTGLETTWSVSTAHSDTEDGQHCVLMSCSRWTMETHGEVYERQAQKLLVVSKMYEGWTGVCLASSTSRSCLFELVEDVFTCYAG
jgi:hypothetical protein